MDQKDIRVRFAPSPTGTLHVGNARTAVLNYVFAKKYGATFVLRIEDTDRERSTDESTTGILDDLRWLGIQWDEGPGAEGNYGPYEQSARLDIYQKYLNQLIEEHIVYPCFCSAEELDRVRTKQKENKERPRYPGTCRNLDLEAAKKRIDAGEPYVLRYKIRQEEITFEDGVRGTVTMPTEMFGGDFVVQKSDGFPTYNFAVVVDDGLMKISHVLRGEDHLANTGKQVLLYRDLDFKTPKYFHMSMILGSDRSKLSKRHGSTTVREFKDKHLLPESLFNYLCLLGWNPGDDREIFSTEDLIEAFSVERLNKSAAIFDPEKLRWINEKKFAEASEETFLETVHAVAQNEFEKLPWTKSEVHEKLLLLRPLIKTPEQAKEFLLILSREAESDESGAVTEFEKFLPIANVVLQYLRDHGLSDFDALKKSVQEQTAAKGKELFQSLRVLLTGQVHGPDLGVLFPALDLPKTIQKITQYVEK
jgi:nondiscriminating glutamyl-tRNA synthetase